MLQVLCRPTSIFLTTSLKTIFLPSHSTNMIQFQLLVLSLKTIHDLASSLPLWGCDLTVFLHHLPLRSPFSSLCPNLKLLPSSPQKCVRQLSVQNTGFRIKHILFKTLFCQLQTVWPWDLTALSQFCYLTKWEQSHLVGWLWGLCEIISYDLSHYQSCVQEAGITSDFPRRQSL